MAAADIAEVQQVFRNWDSTGTGKISKPVLAQVIQFLLPELAEERVWNLVESASGAFDGADEAIKYDVWLDWLMSGIKPHRLPITEPCIERFQNNESLFDAQEGVGTQLLRGSWLIEQAQQGRVLPRRQELPQEAFVPNGDLRKHGIWTREEKGIKAYAVVALSHCWLTPEHPDPKGEQLAKLAPVLKSLQSRGTELAVFLDWCSLHQHPRATREEVDGFNAGLAHVNLWFAHKNTHVLLLTRLPQSWAHTTPYSQRGWPFFELASSSLLTHSGMVLDLQNLDDALERGNDLCYLLLRCKANRLPPMSPDRFAARLLESADACASNQHGLLQFSRYQDRALVTEMYGTTIRAILTSAERLAFVEAGWGPQEAADLAGALSLAPRLKELYLGRNQFGDSGVTLLAQGLAGLINLRILSLDCNQISDAGLSALAISTLPRMSALSRLDLGGNQIGDTGVAVFAQVAAPCLMALSELILSKNVVGDAGATTLAQSCLTDPLRQLDIRKNRIGDEAKQRLRDAWKIKVKPWDGLRLCF